MMAAELTSSQGMCISDLLGNTELPADLLVTGMQLDSRLVQPGDLFVALKGAALDGRAYIADAISRGAVAVLAESDGEAPVSAGVPVVAVAGLGAQVGAIAARFFAEPSRDLHVVGVTGTNGKTTVSRLIAQLLRHSGRQCGAMGTLGSTLGDDVVEAANTTPDPVSLQQQLAAWRDEGVQAASMEVSSHALDQGRVNGVTFNTAVFTNISRDHLDYHGTEAAYVEAKKRLFTWPELEHAVINLDDPYSKQIRAAANAEVVSYSLRADAGADLTMGDIEYYAGGVRGRMTGRWGDAYMHSPLPGHFNVANVLAAVAAVTLSGVPFADVAAAVSHLQPVPGRLQQIPNTLGLQVVVDYAHTPDALEQVLDALHPHVTGRLIVVFGCGGDRDRGKRPLMGRVACAHADWVLITSDNPRSEDPERIVSEVEAGCSGEFVSVVDRAEAIETAIRDAAAGDCVLIAGKGHEDYQLVGDARLEFCDASHAAAALSRRAGS